MKDYDKTYPMQYKTILDGLLDGSLMLSFSRKKNKHVLLCKGACGNCDLDHPFCSQHFESMVRFLKSTHLHPELFL